MASQTSAIPEKSGAIESRIARERTGTRVLTRLVAAFMTGKSSRSDLRSLRTSRMADGSSTSLQRPAGWLMAGPSSVMRAVTTPERVAIVSSG